jgi:hypothetical protein
VSISNAQRRPVPNAHWIGTVHHGMPEGLLKPVPADPSYLAFLGRIGLALGKWRALLKERGAFHGQAAATVREGI